MAQLIDWPIQERVSHSGRRNKHWAGAGVSRKFFILAALAREPRIWEAKGTWGIGAGFALVVSQPSFIFFKMLAASRVACFDACFRMANNSQASRLAACQTTKCFL